MRVLVLGGTQFIGRAAVERLLAHGHDVTLLNRGQTAPALFPGVPRIVADRAALTRETFGDEAWDVVVDMVPMFPRDVATTFAALAGKMRRYVMCSTGSVYADLHPYPVAEHAPIHDCTPEQAVDESLATYGPRKAECVRRAQVLCAERGVELFIARPVVVYGPHDYTDRMHFWLESVKRGRVVFPDGGLSIFRCIYVSDLADIFVRMVEADPALAGTYNAAGTELFSLRDLVDAAVSVVGAEPQIAHVPGERLVALGVRPQFDLPIWLADESGKTEHVIMDVSRAQQRLGFRSTPLAETLRATWDAYRADPRVPLKTVMDPDRLWSLVHDDTAPGEPTILSTPP